MDDQEQRNIALTKLQQFRADTASDKDPVAAEVAAALEEQRRSKARNRLVGAGKVALSHLPK
jgi:formate-dependent nitrite reductase cytochrome c552 subunit